MAYPKNRNSQSRRLTHEEFLDRLWRVKCKDDFEVLENYTLQQTPMKFLHKKCGNLFLATPNNMCKENYGGCPICGNNSRIKTKRDNSTVDMSIVLKKIDELYPNNEYKIDINKSTYTNNKVPSLFLICSKCSNTFPISYVNLCKGKGCPICNKLLRQESRNIKKIKEYLTLNNIEYECEYSFQNCKNERILKFDIAVTINGHLKLIEYDGEFHDRGYNNDKISLEKVKINDTIKTEYCIKNNIPLLRLRYNTFNNYEEQLRKFLSE